MNEKRNLFFYKFPEAEIGKYGSISLGAYACRLLKKSNESSNMISSFAVKDSGARKRIGEDIMMKWDGEKLGKIFLKCFAKP